MPAPVLRSWKTRLRNCEIEGLAGAGPIEGEHPYAFLDGIVMKRTWAGEVRNVSLLVAIGVNAEGFREILGICEGRQGGQVRLVGLPPVAWWTVG